MSELTKIKPFYCTDEEEKLFKSLYKAVKFAPVILQFNPKRKIDVSIDASSIGIGAVMEQEFDNVRQSVCFASKTLSSA